MSCALIFMMMLLGSSVVIAFVLQPSEEESAAPVNAPVPTHRCQGESLQSLRKGLLGALNLQTEPKLPVGGLDRIREQWRSTFNKMAHRAQTAVAPEVSSYSLSPDGGNGTRCCSLSSEIFMKDLGWDNWVIHPTSLTIVQCAVCNPEMNVVQCPPFHTNVQDADPQVKVPCCQSTSQEMVPIVYVDEFSTLVISSVQLSRGCSCAHGNIQ